MFPQQGAASNGALAAGATGVTGSSPVNMDTTQPHDMNYNGLQQQQPHQQQQQVPAQPTQRGVRKKPYVRIIEQPASKALRFRYECEGRSAGSIPGVNSTPENKTYPTIEIVGYKGRAVVVVSCVTKDPPYRPHPHNLVGKEGCKKGVCTLEINSETMRAVFSNLGIQCVKKKDIEAALKAREEIRVDPFKTGFTHRFHPSSIDLNSVRLCFQVFMESEQKGRFTQPLAPVVSEPIFDKKAMSELAICRLCSCSASVMGNTQIILLCEKVAKEDIAVRFFEEENGQLVWEAYGEFQHTDVHKQTAITFKTPRYRNINITEAAKVFIQLKRPSDGVTSLPLEFEYVPLSSGRPKFWQLHQNLKRKPDLDIFQQILSVDAGESKPSDIIDLDATETPNTDEEAAKRRKEHEIDSIIDEKVRELDQQQQHQQRQQGEEKPMDLMEQEQEHDQDQYSQQLGADDKINDWMKTNELQHLDASAITTATSTAIAAPVDPDLAPAATIVPMDSAHDEDKTLTELLEQVAELDEIYTDHVLRRNNISGPYMQKGDDSIMKELQGMDSCVPDTSTLADGGQTSMDIDDNFDDAATYSSLQIAFKHPIPMEDVMPPTPPASQMAPEDALYDPVEVLPALPTAANSEPSSVGLTNSITNALSQSPPRPAPPRFTSPHMHVTAAVEEKVPPLPPKRLRKQDSNAENRSIEANIDSISTERKSRPVAGPIIIMKTPDHSPPTKRLPPKPGNNSNMNTNTLPKQKKQGFFSKLFSRRKSKSELSHISEQNSIAGSKMGSKATSLNGSREPSIGHFNMNDSNRASIRSAKSLQPHSLPSSPDRGSNKAPKVGKPVGRSVSSVSGKRPTHLNADVVHIPLKGESANSLPPNEAYSNASTMTLGNTLDRKTVSALQLADIPICEGGMELVAIASRQSLRDLCEGEFNVQLDPDVDLTEAEHFALYTSIPPQATASEFDETSAYYAPVDAGEILTPEEFARRIAAVNNVDQ